MKRIWTVLIALITLLTALAFYRLWDAKKREEVSKPSHMTNAGFAGLTMTAYDQSQGEARRKYTLQAKSLKTSSKKFGPFKFAAALQIVIEGAMMTFFENDQEAAFLQAQAATVDVAQSLARGQHKALTIRKSWN